MRRTIRERIWTALLLTIAVATIGMIGYHFTEDHISWIEAYMDAALIMSGMGPSEVMETPGGQLFEGTYSLFCGLIYLPLTLLLLAPALHELATQFITERERNRSSASGGALLRSNFPSNSS